MKRLALLFATLLISADIAAAASFRTEAENEAAVRELSAQLRCPVCQSENILDSQSGTAREMVEIVREQLAEGRSQAEIIAYFRERYGDYVMLSPPASGFGALVWVTPLLLLLAGGGTYLLLLRRNTRAKVEETASRAPLTEERLEGLEL